MSAVLPGEPDLLGDLSMLPEDVLQGVVLQLPLLDARSLARTCKSLLRLVSRWRLRCLGFTNLPKLQPLTSGSSVLTVSHITALHVGRAWPHWQTKPLHKRRFQHADQYVQEKARRERRYADGVAAALQRGARLGPQLQQLQVLHLCLPRQALPQMLRALQLLSAGGSSMQYDSNGGGSCGGGCSSSSGVGSSSSGLPRLRTLITRVEDGIGFTHPAGPAAMKDSDALNFCCSLPTSIADLQLLWWRDNLPPSYLSHLTALTSLAAGSLQPAPGGDNGTFLDEARCALHGLRQLQLLTASPQDVHIASMLSGLRCLCLYINGELQLCHATAFDFLPIGLTRLMVIDVACADLEVPMPVTMKPGVTQRLVNLAVLEMSCYSLHLTGLTALQHLTRLLCKNLLHEEEEDSFLQQSAVLPALRSLSCEVHLQQLARRCPGLTFLDYRSWEELVLRSDEAVKHEEAAAAMRAFGGGGVFAHLCEVRLSLHALLSAEPATFAHVSRLVVSSFVGRLESASTLVVLRKLPLLRSVVLPHAYTSVHHCTSGGDLLQILLQSAPQLTSITVGVGFTRNDLDPLLRFRELQRLRLQFLSFTPDLTDLSTLAGITSLTRLEVVGCNVSEAVADAAAAQARPGLLYVQDRKLGWCVGEIDEASDGATDAVFGPLNQVEVDN